MLPWLGVALVALYIGYVAYEASQAREQARLAMPASAGPDPVEELERINTEISRLATQGRQSLERARDTMQRGLKG